MKIRMKGNSIRLRLTQSELKELGERGALYETVEFGDSALKYGLEIKGNNLSAAFDANCINVLIPETQAEKWISDDAEVGIEGEVAISSEKHLHLLVEKDFVCLTERPGEDESDNFPNPLAGHNC